MDCTRHHSSDDMTGLGEFEGITEPVAVVIRPDGSVDIYGYVAVIDQRGSEEDEEPPAGEYDPGPEIDDEGGMSEYRHYEPDEYPV